MKPRILIVDADEAITQQLFWTLSDNYDVLTANDMQTAVRRAQVYEPAVSILDLHLPPEEDSPAVGLKILKYIKAHLPQSKILVMSAISRRETRTFCSAVGADEFLYKPFDIEKLLSLIGRLAPRRWDPV